jgi:hypothetical protein
MAWASAKDLAQQATPLQGYLADKKQHSPRNPQKDHALGPVVSEGGGAVSDERGTPVNITSSALPFPELVTRVPPPTAWDRAPLPHSQFQGAFKPGHLDCSPNVADSLYKS